MGGGWESDDGVGEREDVRSMMYEWKNSLVVRVVARHDAGEAADAVFGRRGTALRAGFGVNAGVV